MTTFAIATNELSKTYKDKQALKPLTLSIPFGEIFGFLGHNGAGKTTTINLLTSLLEPTSGSFEIAGVDGLKSPKELRGQIGYLPESIQIYNNMTTLENLRFFARLSGMAKPDQRILEVLSFLDFVGNKDKKVGSFSKGMRQRVGLAQSILHKPKVLFLDEPTSGLDPEGVLQLRELILSLNKDLGMTIFMNTHLLSEVTKTCTSIGILRGGNLAYQNSVAATLAEFPDRESLEAIYMNIEAA